MNYKAKLLDVMDGVMDHLDTLDNDEKAALIANYQLFSHQVVEGLATYATSNPDIRPTIKAGLKKRNDIIRASIKG